MGLPRSLGKIDAQSAAADSVLSPPRNRRRRGFAAMMGVLVIGSVSLVTALATANVFLQESRETSKRADAVQARASAYSCASVAVLRLKRNSSYAGNENISNGRVVCSIGATVVSGSARTLYAQATVNGLTSRIRVDFSGINTSQFYLNSWTEIPPL